MSYLSLYRKWRPGGFSDVLGQAHVTETLVGALRDDRVAHAYLFAGPRGTGKTSTARILAKALNCAEGPGPEPCGKCTSCREITEGSSLDVYEMDAASHTSVDDVREIRERIPFASTGGGHKVYIIDEAHQLSNPAFNALLKMLEEPPPHVVFVLCTTESHKLPATVVSRCQRFEFRRLSASVVAEHLAQVAVQEGIDAQPDALALIARHARGSARDALSLLDQAAGTADGKVTREAILDILGEAPEDVLFELAEAVSKGDIVAVFTHVERMTESGWDPRQLLRQLLEQVRVLFLAARGAQALVDADPEHRQRLVALADRFGAAHLEWALRVLGEAQADMRLATHPRLTLEVALARASCLEVPEDKAFLARLERLERHVLQHGDAHAPAPEVRASPPQAPPSPQTQDSPVPQPPPAAQPPSSPAPQERPAAAKPQPAAPAPPSADAGLEGRWQVFLDAVKTRKRTTHALIKEGWPVEVSDGVLLVGFERTFHAEEIQKPVHTGHLAAALEHAFGAKLRVWSQVMERRAQPAAAPVEQAPDAEPASPVDLVKQGLGAEVVEEVDS